MASALTPLGERTKQGFEAKWGKQVGDRKFQEALDKGLIDRGKMENVMLAADEEDPTEGMQATPGNPSGGGQPLPKGNVGRGAQGSFQKRPG